MVKGETVLETLKVNTHKEASHSDMLQELINSFHKLHAQPHKGTSHMDLYQGEVSCSVYTRALVTGTANLRFDWLLLNFVWSQGQVP